MVNIMVMVLPSGKMEVNMKVIFKMENFMVKGSIHGKMVASIQDHIKMVYEMEQVNFFSMMDIFTVENGIKER